MANIKQIEKTKIIGKEKHTVYLKLEDLGQGAYFSVTMNTDRLDKYGNWYCDSCGCQHEEVAKHFPEFAKYLKWHLVAVGKQPMHYLANSLYWAGKEGFVDGKAGSPPNYECFKSTAIIGVLPGDSEMTPTKMLLWSQETLKSWLEVRLPALMKAFDSDLKELW